MQDTKTTEYTKRLIQLESIWWKKILSVQAPYAWNLRRLQLGFVLDIGCGIGRNLNNLNGHAVGVDHNADSILTARSRGFEAYTTHEFLLHDQFKQKKFDSILFAHILEHLNEEEQRSIILSYVKYLKPHGKIVIIVPQRAGYKSDPTHKIFVDEKCIKQIGNEVNLTLLKLYSFPFLKIIGNLFKYNELVAVFKIN